MQSGQFGGQQVASCKPFVGLDLSLLDSSSEEQRPSFRLHLGGTSRGSHQGMSSFGAEAGFGNGASSLAEGPLAAAALHGGSAAGTNWQTNGGECLLG